MGIEDLKHGMYAGTANKYLLESNTCKNNKEEAEIEESTEQTESNVTAKDVITVIKKLLARKIHAGEAEVTNDTLLGHCTMIRDEDEEDQDKTIHIKYSLGFDTEVDNKILDEVDTWLEGHNFVTFPRTSGREVIFEKTHEVPGEVVEEAREVTTTIHLEPKEVGIVRKVLLTILEIKPDSIVDDEDKIRSILTNRINPLDEERSGIILNTINDLLELKPDGINVDDLEALKQKLSKPEDVTESVEEESTEDEDSEILDGAEDGESVEGDLSEDDINTLTDAINDFIDTLDEEDSRREELQTILIKLVPANNDIEEDDETE